MKRIYSITPNSLTSDSKIEAEFEGTSFTLANVGAYTYAWNLEINEPSQFCNPGDNIALNVHIGRFCSIANGLSISCGVNHDYKCVSTGAVNLLLQKNGLCFNDYNDGFIQKGTVIIKNDVWIGENVSIMSGVTVNDGAVVAKNSHVVKDVPPYAIVGGNLAKVIGYRFDEDIISKFTRIKWWNWEEDKIVDAFTKYGKDVKSFCDEYFIEEPASCICDAKDSKSSIYSYFSFVDYLEGYPSYPHIIETFLDKCFSNVCELNLFVRNDLSKEISSSTLNQLQDIVDALKEEIGIKCQINLIIGNEKDAIKKLSRAHAYIINRMPGTLGFIDRAMDNNIRIISGVDNIIMY